MAKVAFFGQNDAGFEVSPAMGGEATYSCRPLIGLNIL
jgi:hypothetical protein